MMRHRFSPIEAFDIIEADSKRTVLYDADAEYPESIGPSDAPRCMAACRAEFVKGLGIDVAADPPSVLESLCQKIVGERLSSWFLDLYCCDTKYCGLGVAGLATRQDPNIDSIIDQCENIGISGIIDPGPPQWDRCGSIDENPFRVLSITPGAAAGDSNTQLETQTKSVASPSPTGSSIISTATGTDVSGVSTSSNNTGTSTAPPTSPHGLDVGGAVAIGLCAAVAALTLVLALLYLRRRRRSKGYIRTSPRSGIFVSRAQPPDSSRASLVTPPPSSSSSPLQPLTPPLRLCDRRYLSPVAGHSSVRSPSAPSYSSQTMLSLPESRAPTAKTSKLVAHPHHATSPSLQTDSSRDNLASGVTPNRMASITYSPGAALSLNATESAKTSSQVSTLTTIVNPPGPETPPLPLPSTRPQYPHDSPPRVPDLVMPTIAPPPPPPHKYTLQPVPQGFHLQTSPIMETSPPYQPQAMSRSPVSPLSPTSTLGTPRQKSFIPAPKDIGVAIGSTRIDQHPNTILQPASSNIYDLTDMRNTKSSESRESWGSWSDIKEDRVP